jgi:hypothetical protein
LLAAARYRRPGLVTFVCHPFSASAAANAREVLQLARALVLSGHLPLAPQIYLPQFLDEATERDLALRLCLRMVALANEVRVYGETSEGMRLEVAEAVRLGIPIVRGKLP